MSSPLHIGSLRWQTPLTSYTQLKPLKPATQPVCATCSAIPLELFQRPPQGKNRLSTVELNRQHEMSEGERGRYVFGQGPNNIGGLEMPEDCCYQHYSGSDAPMAMSSSSKRGCPLCT